MIALLNLSVLEFLFMFHDKAKRTQQGNLLCLFQSFYLSRLYKQIIHKEEKGGAEGRHEEKYKYKYLYLNTKKKLVQRPNISNICVIEKMHGLEFDISPVNSHIVSFKLKINYLNECVTGSSF